MVANEDLILNKSASFQNSHEKHSTGKSLVQLKNIGTDYTYKHEVVWKNAIGFLILHFFALWGFFLFITGCVKLVTVIWGKCAYFFILT